MAMTEAISAGTCNESGDRDSADNQRSKEVGKYADDN